MSISLLISSSTGILVSISAGAHSGIIFSSPKDKEVMPGPSWVN